MLQTAIRVTMPCAVDSAYPRREPVVSRFLVERTVADDKPLAILPLLHLEIR